jgi:hypothetical protein
MALARSGLAALIGLLLVAGCRSETADKLVGSWNLDARFAKGTTTFMKDKTYVQTVTGLTAGSERGSWRVDGNKLITTAQTSTLNKDAVGKDETATIVSVDEAVPVLEVENRKGETESITFQRVR